MSLSRPLQAMTSILQKIFRKSVDVSECCIGAFYLNKHLKDAQRRDCSGVFLVEFHSDYSSHIPTGFLVETFLCRFSPQIFAYLPTPITTRTRSSVHKLLFKISLAAPLIYRTFGASSLLCFGNLSQPRRYLYSITASNLLNTITSKHALERLEIRGIRFGDLIYDQYLRKYSRPTIDIDSHEFRQFFQQSVFYILDFIDYFERFNVVGVSVSHCVYLNAVPLRIASSMDIPCFQPTLTHLYRLDSHRPYAYSSETKDYHSLFISLSPAQQSQALSVAEQRLSQRFSGKVAVDMPYSTASAYSSATTDSLVLANSNRFKVLIATHCFFDSPHSYGLNLFPDFYEWLSFLGRLSTETDYDWYLKRHPDPLPGNKPIIKQFLSDFPSITEVPCQISHHQLIAEGINVALTVHGTIASEYSALGLPVINASPANPHSPYGFSITPSSVLEYESAIRDISRTSFSPDLSEVYEYYYMRNCYYSLDVFFKRGVSPLDVFDYPSLFRPSIYRRYFAYLVEPEIREIKSALSVFVASSDHRFSRIHFGS